MIKLLKKYQIKISPFEAKKDWILSTTNNDDLLLIDSGSLEDNPVALEFIDYGSITSSLPTLDSLCNIALEQQDDDLINIREGLKTTGIFYPDKDPINNDRTYKRVVYSQVNTMFYNHYGNPIEIFGLENIDFGVGKTKRIISDHIELLDIPTNIFGDKIVPDSIRIVNSATDNEYIIKDDSYGNLLAGTNLFSKQQEIGEHTNFFITGSDSSCNTYFSFSTPNTPLLGGSKIVNGVSLSSSLSWSINHSLPYDGFVLQRSSSLGSGYSDYQLFPSTTVSYIDTNIITLNEYLYRLRSFNAFGDSGYSNIVDIVT